MSRPRVVRSVLMSKSVVPFYTPEELLRLINGKWKLTGQNFPVWKMHLDNVLSAQGKLYILEKPVSRPKSNSPEEEFAQYFKYLADEYDVMSILIFSISPEFSGGLRDKSCHEVVKDIENQLGFYKHTSKLLIMKEILSLKQKKNQSIKDHLINIRRLFKCLTRLGYKMAQEELMHLMWYSLPKELCDTASAYMKEPRKDVAMLHEDILASLEPKPAPAELMDTDWIDELGDLSCPECGSQDICEHSMNIDQIEIGLPDAPATPVNGLYTVNLQDDNKEIYHIGKRSKDIEDQTYLWHCRIGHINKKHVELLLKIGFLGTFDFKPFDNCESCLSGKMTKEPFNKDNERASNLLEIVHTDVCGPFSHEARGGYRYFITFTDDFSRYGYVYLMRHKSESFEKFREYQNEVQNQLDRKIKFLRSDRGGEYLSQEFGNHLIECGIVSQLTPPYTPQMNGVSERRNRTLLDMVRSMMCHSTLPVLFWGHALETTAHILNRAPTKSVERTPYELWKGKKPKMSFLKIWGCEVYVKRPTSEKLKPKSDKCFFVGYPKITVGYYFYNPEKNKVFVARNGKFMEEKFLSSGNSREDVDLQTSVAEEVVPTSVDCCGKDCLFFTSADTKNMGSKGIGSAVGKSTWASAAPRSTRTALGSAAGKSTWASAAPRSTRTALGSAAGKKKTNKLRQESAARVLRGKAKRGSEALLKKNKHHLNGIDFWDVYGGFIRDVDYGGLALYDEKAKHKSWSKADIKLLGSLDREDLKKLCGDNFPEWISFPVYEQAKWLNKQLSKLWPYIAEATTIIIKESVEPILEQYRPSGISALKFSKLSLGTVAPKIEGIRIQSLKEGQITMDMDFRWGGNPDIVLGVDTGVASLPIQLKDLQIFTIIRVIFQLCEEIPCISAVVVALLSEPKPRFDYTVKAIGGSITAIPGLSDMIEDTVTSIITDMLQWPHRIVVPLGGTPVDTSELELKPQGKLTITIVKADHLKNMEMMGKSDPYAVAFVRPLEKFKTQVIENNLNPVWNETFHLTVEDKDTQFAVFDEDIGADQRLGIVKLPLVDLQPEVEKEIQLRLQPSLDMLKVKDKKEEEPLQSRYHALTKEEQHAALAEEKKMLEEKEKQRDEGTVNSTMDAVHDSTHVGA
ncbi:hypothetical protein OSB04_011168 [Centaurea solstitialis]|uniref:Uncharacterized protein n=1 Tax=Centaurea solstitialis TaxID=347529 RepID=A0AA38TAM2_9ASTR|nr:hypothetical protein OSB04_011168 [Centaurea solstitialis]